MIKKSLLRKKNMTRKATRRWKKLWHETDHDKFSKWAIAWQKWMSTIETYFNYIKYKWANIKENFFINIFNI